MYVLGTTFKFWKSSNNFPPRAQGGAGIGMVRLSLTKITPNHGPLLPVCAGVPRILSGATATQAGIGPSRPRSCDDVYYDWLPRWSSDRKRDCCARGHGFDSQVGLNNMLLGYMGFFFFI